MGFTHARTIYLNVGFANTNPLDSTTYYFADKSGSVLTTVANYRYLSIPYAGKITGCSVSMIAGTVTGTNESIDLKIRVNNTTDYDVGTIATASVQRVIRNMNLDISVAQGDFIELKLTTPAWATNPEGVYGGGGIVLHY